MKFKYTISNESVKLPGMDRFTRYYQGTVESETIADCFLTIAKEFPGSKQYVITKVKEPKK